VNDTILEKLRGFSPDSILESSDFRGDLAILIRKGDIANVCRFLRDDPILSFSMLIDLCGVDRFTREGRFEIVYHLYSLKNRHYLRLKARVEEDDPTVETVTSVWTGANWHERETYDMFGITFTGHPDLRRMYMPEDYEHFPLRKDFPLMGIPDSIPLPGKK